MTEKITVGQFYIRPYKTQDEIKINRVFNAVFRTDRTLPEWEWKFKKSNGSRILLAFNEQNKLISQYAVTTYKFQYFDQCLTAGQSVDNFSRRKGQAVQLKLFEKVVQHFFQIYGSKTDVGVMFGFPGMRHLKLGTIKLDYGEAVPIPYWEKKIKSRISHSEKEPISPSISTLDISQLNSLWQSSKSRYPVSIIRDGEWYFNRFKSKPNNNYSFLEISWQSNYQCFAVYCIREDKLEITDIIWNGRSDQDLIHMEHKINNAAIFRGIDKVSMWFSGDKQAEAIFKSQGWKKKREPLDLHMVVKNFDASIKRQKLREHFYLTKACSDSI